MLLLLRVRVDDEVGLVEARNIRDVEACVAKRLHRGRGHDLDRVEVVRLQRGDHRVVVRELLQPELVDLRLRAPVGVVALEDRDVVLLELDEVERAGPDDWRVVRERLQVGALVARVLRPDVLREDEELLKLPEYPRRPGRLVVVDDERRRVRGGRVRDVVDEPRRVRGTAALVLDVGVDRPGRVGRSQRLAVAPLGVRLCLERPGLAAVRGVPRLGEERGVVEVAVVLDEDRIDVLEGAVRVLVERDVRVEGVDAAGRARGGRCRRSCRCWRWCCCCCVPPPPPQPVAVAASISAPKNSDSAASHLFFIVALPLALEWRLVHRQRACVGVERITDP